MAADMLDTPNMSRYLASFRRHAKGSPKLWGLHNYGDVNRRRTTFTEQMLRTVPGEVWLTETGGIVKLLPSFKPSPRRAPPHARKTCSGSWTAMTRAGAACARRSRGCSFWLRRAQSPARASTPVWSTQTARRARPSPSSPRTPGRTARRTGRMRSSITITINHPDELAPNGVVPAELDRRAPRWCGHLRPGAVSAALHAMREAGVFADRRDEVRRPGRAGSCRSRRGATAIQRARRKRVCSPRMSSGDFAESAAGPAPAPRGSNDEELCGSAVRGHVRSSTSGQRSHPKRRRRW